MTRIAAVVLAAGRSSRYRAAGGREETKLVAQLAGEAVVRRVVGAAVASRAQPVIVVVGHAQEAVVAALAGLPARIVGNPDFASGLASSLRAGIKALPAEIEGAVICLGDMPGVTPALVDMLIGAFEAAPGAQAAAPTTEGHRGNPVLLGRALFPAAIALDGDEGARRLLGALDPGKLAEVEIGGPSASFDVDTPADLEFAQRNARKPLPTP